eukprot:CAMPEP_0119118646 /NCGR_PEP_ID=MMETSP1310-20130426/459_1 /TAXON_ID=464262 /ORGANISM="Genus nov. species nov., Strain RCC2339" /LENGTH=144 /DNA_ID=CAMNT_0007108033 /DNA_START=55 /DNA_END=489 /DNA_ORIENTATION=-
MVLVALGTMLLAGSTLATNFIDDGMEFFQYRVCTTVSGAKDYECCSLAALCYSCLASSECTGSDATLATKCLYPRCPPGYTYSVREDGVTTVCVSGASSVTPFTSLADCLDSTDPPVAENDCYHPLRVATDACLLKEQSTVGSS